jgi:hypothetical protein
VKHTEPQYAELSPEMRERLEKFREDHDGEPLGGVATEVLFEDGKVRIWQMTLEPGEASDLHHHEHDYYLAISEGDLVAGIPPKGSGVEPFVGIIPPEGNTVHVPKGGTEWAYNVGTKTYREILIELLTT